MHLKVLPSFSLQPLIHLDRAISTMAYCNSSIYVFSGEFNGAYFYDMWRFDIPQQKWSKLFSMENPSARFYPQLCSLENDLYLHGGKCDTSESLNDFWRFSDNTWHKLPDGPRRGYHNMAAAMGKLFVFGGFSRYINVEILNDLWYYEDLSFIYNSVSTKIAKDWKATETAFLMDSEVSDSSVSADIAALFSDTEMCDLTFELEGGKVVQGVY